MPTKTELEKVRVDSKGSGTPAAMVQVSQSKMVPVSEANYMVPESIAHLLAEGFSTQRHCKLTEGTYVRGIFEGMEDGELSARTDRNTGEVTAPKVKWVYVRVAQNQTVRLLGAYNMIAQLERTPVGSEILIGRGADYLLPNNFHCTEYFVFSKPPVAGSTQAAGAQTVDASAQAQA